MTVPERTDLQSVLADIRMLVELETPTGDAAALARGHEALRELVAKRIGPATSLTSRSGTLCWTWGDGQDSVLLLGHVDTVWPVGTLASFPFSVDGDVARGPGTFDMKAGLVIAIHAIAAALGVADSDHRPRVRLLVTSDEETGSHESRTVIEELAAQASAVLCLEGSAPGGGLKIERKGTAHYRVRVHGRAAHAGLEPEKGVNAAVELGHVLTQLSSIGDPAVGTSVTPTIVSGGTVRNAVPESAEVVVDVRASTTAEFERVESELRALAGTPTLPGARIEIAGSVGRPPMDRRTSAGLFAMAEQLCERLGIETPEGVSVGGGSDANFSAQLGVPTLDGLGAVGGGAHARSEHVDLRALLPRIALVASLIGEVTRRGPDALAPSAV